MTAANSGDVISIYANLNEQILLKNGVDVYIDPGTVINYSSAGPTITDNNVLCICNITGRGIIKNTYTGTLKQECVKISNTGSIVNIECHRIEGQGEYSSGIEGASVDITASKFRLLCDKISSKYNTAIKITDCNDLFLRIRTVESGSPADPNAGAPVMTIDATGSMYINELKCTGYGSCLEHKDGIIGATINKIYTLLTNDETPSAAAPNILLDNGTGNQELVLYFDEIKNLNTNEGDAVKITEGRASLIGRRIYCTQGKSLDLITPIKSAFIQCDEIISLTQGININNSDEPIVIDANFIEGSDGNDGVIKCNDNCNLILRNAKIRNTTSSTSRGIYIKDNNVGQKIELENLIIITGLKTGDNSIFRAGSTNINIKNLLLFVNKEKSAHITFLIGTLTNFKYIEDSSIS